MSKNFKYQKPPECPDVPTLSIITGQKTETPTSTASPRIFTAFTTTFAPGKTIETLKSASYLHCEKTCINTQNVYSFLLSDQIIASTVRRSV